MASRVPNINIDQRSNIKMDDVNAIFVKFEQNIAKYVTYRNTTILPDVAENVESICAWVEEQKTSSGGASQHKDISDVGNVLKTLESSIPALSSDQPVEVMEGCLNIVRSITAVLGGPFGTLIADPLCGSLGTILSLSTPNEPDLAMVFIRTVQLELQKFNGKLLRQKFHGLIGRVKSMISNLKMLQSTKEDVDLPDKALFETDFPQFIGELSESFEREISAGSKEEDINDCLRSVVIYCNAQTLLLLLLAKVLVTFRVTGRQTMFIQTLLNDQKADAIEKLEFPSYFTILQLRRNRPFYQVVEKFREGLGMTKMPEFDTVISGPKGISDRYPQPQMKGVDHYFQLINHTDFPIKVVCDGFPGDFRSGVKFCKDVQPRSSYEHIAPWFFSIGGFFVIYLDGAMRTSDNMFEGRNLKVFEFAMSNPFIGPRRSALLEKTHNLQLVTGKDCWKQMNSNASQPIYFVHNKQYFVVFGGLTGIGNFKDNPGKDSCHTWRFVVSGSEER